MFDIIFDSQRLSLITCVSAFQDSLAHYNAASDVLVHQSRWLAPLQVEEVAKACSLMDDVDAPEEHLDGVEGPSTLVGGAISPWAKESRSEFDISPGPHMVHCGTGELEKHEHVT